MYYFLKPSKYVLEIKSKGCISDLDFNAYMDIFDAEKIAEDKYEISETPTNMGVLRLKLNENSVDYELK